MWVDAFHLAADAEVEVRTRDTLVSETCDGFVAAVTGDVPSDDRLFPGLGAICPAQNFDRELFHSSGHLRQRDGQVVIARDADLVAVVVGPRHLQVDAVVNAEPVVENRADVFPEPRERRLDIFVGHETAKFRLEIFLDQEDLERHFVGVGHVGDRRQIQISLKPDFFKLLQLFV